MSTKTLPANHFSRPAVRRGPFYCAPWCGGNCTWEAYQKAKRDSKALATLLGKGWKPRVWENLGWHYEVKSPCNRVSVGSHAAEHYSAMFGQRGDYGGLYCGDGKTPQKAIRAALKKAEMFLVTIGARLVEPVKFNP